MSAVKKYPSYLKEKNHIPRLSINGLIIYCTNSTTSIQIKKFDWADALVDACHH